MLYIVNICFVCLKTVYLNRAEDYTIKQIEYVLPDMTLEPEIPVYICPTCHTELLSFSTFKKQCLENYCRLKHYINLLQGSGNTSDQSFSVLQIQINNLKQERQLNVVNVISATAEDHHDQTNFVTEEYNEIKDEISSEAQNLYQQLLSDVKKESDSKEDLINEDTNEMNQDETNYSEIEDRDVNSFCKDNLSYETIVSSHDNAVKDTCTINLSNTKIFDCTVGNIQLSPGLNETKKSHIKNKFTGSDDIKEFPCSVCDKKTKLKINQKKRMNMYYGIKNFECIKCRKKIKNKSNLTAHLKRHAGIKSFHCSICDRIFTRRYTLNRHMKIHTGIKDFRCTICDKNFTQKDNLIRHMKIHTGTKDFQCPICDKKFAEKNNVKIHMKIHYGIKDFQCSICNKKFRQRNDLKVHMKTQHDGIKNFECHLCNKKFACKKYLAAHVKKHNSMTK